MFIKNIWLYLKPETLEEDVPDFETLSEEDQLAIVNGTYTWPQSGEADEWEPEGEDPTDPDPVTGDVDEDPEPTEDPKDPVEPEKKKPKSWIQDLLSERTENRTKIKDLEAEVATLKQGIWQWDTEADDAYIDKRTHLIVAKADMDRAEKVERDSFFNSNPQAVKDKEDLEVILQKYPDMSYKHAYAHLLAVSGRAWELMPKDQPKSDKFATKGRWWPSAPTEQTTEQYEEAQRKAVASGKHSPFQGRK